MRGSALSASALPFLLYSFSPSSFFIFYSIHYYLHPYTLSYTLCAAYIHTHTYTPHKHIYTIYTEFGGRPKHPKLKKDGYVTKYG